MLWFLFVGLVAGWIAGTLVKGRGFGLVGDIIVGVIGSFIGGMLFRAAGIAAYGTIGGIAMATIGAIVLLFIVKLAKQA